jgi:hypothetical protein
MSAGKLVPVWFKNTLATIGFYSLLVFIHNSFGTSSKLAFVTFYPLILLWIWRTNGMRFEGDRVPPRDEKGQPLTGTYFYFVSLIIVLLFTLILLFDYESFTDFCTRIFSSRFTLLLSNYIEVQKSQGHYSLLGWSLYIVILLYFVTVSFYLSKKIMNSIDKDEELK